MGLRRGGEEGFHSLETPTFFSQWNTRKHREHLVELLFEKYNVPALYLAKSPMLSRWVEGEEGEGV